MKLGRLVLAGILALCLLGVYPQPGRAQDGTPGALQDVIRFNFQRPADWWACMDAPCTYEAPFVSGRMVSGDFNGDGLAEVAALYDYGQYEGAAPSDSYMHVWQSTKSSFSDRTDWWHCGPDCFQGMAVKGRFAAGDFNGDGKDDIAGMYDYGGGKSTLFVWLSTGSAFTLSTWWQCDTCYNASLVTDRLVAGDFNGDKRDDIAGLSDSGNDTSTIHVWLAAGTGFAYQGNNGWWHCADGGCYWASRVTGRVVSGDYNGDGRDDIATMYDFGSNETAMHVFLSSGSAFTYQGTPGWWSCMSVGCYQASLVTGRMVSGDFDGDGRDDIAALYDYGSASSTLHVWLSKGARFAYPGNSGGWQCGPGCYEARSVTDRMMSGDYNGDGRADIAALYDYGNHHAKLHTWLALHATYLPLIMQR